jgi:hypothetical protein
VAFAVGALGGPDVGEGGAGLVGVEQVGGGVGGLLGGQQAQFAPPFDGERMSAESGGGFLKGEKASGSEAFDSGGDVVVDAVVADPVAGEGPSGAVGEALGA